MFCLLGFHRRNHNQNSPIIYTDLGYLNRFDFGNENCCLEDDLLRVWLERSRLMLPLDVLWFIAIIILIFYQRVPQKAQFQFNPFDQIIFRQLFSLQKTYQRGCQMLKKGTVFFNLEFNLYFHPSDLTYLMFDQRMIRPSSDQYYFQLEPISLTIVNPNALKTAKNANSSFRLKIMKGFQMCDQLKKPVEMGTSNGKIPFEKTQLTFYLPSYNPDRNIQFRVILLKINDGKNENEVGKYGIKSGDFISEFKKTKKRIFPETVSIGDEYQITFNLYIEKSRAQLEKAIKGTSPETKKPLSRQKSSPTNQAFNKNNVDIGENSQKADTNSPNRKLIRKHGQRKLLMRGSSPQRSQGSTSKKSRQLKFTKKSPPSSPKTEAKKPSLAEQQIKIDEQKKKQTLTRKQEPEPVKTMKPKEDEKEKLQRQRQQREQKARIAREERQRKMEQEREERKKQQQQQQREEKARIAREERQKKMEQEREERKKQQQKQEREEKARIARQQREEKARVAREQREKKMKQEKQQRQRQEKEEKARIARQEREEKARVAKEERQRKIKEERQEKQRQRERQQRQEKARKLREQRQEKARGIREEKQALERKKTQQKPIQQENYSQKKSQSRPPSIYEPTPKKVSSGVNRSGKSEKSQIQQPVENSVKASRQGSMRNQKVQKQPSKAQNSASRGGSVHGSRASSQSQANKVYLVKPNSQEPDILSLEGQDMDSLNVQSMKRGRSGTEDFVKKTQSMQVRKIYEPKPDRSRSTSRIIPKAETSVVKKSEGTSILMVIFLIISLIALYFVMLPSRKF